MGSHLSGLTRKLVVTLVAAVSVVGFVPAGEAHPSAPDCTPRLLVLSAFPAEMDAVLARAQRAHHATIHVEEKRFYPGQINGKPVMMAMTGIGINNATRTTELALAHFRCDGAPTITGIVFSGVSGTTRRIGDVMVPDRWTVDGGHTFFGTDPAMLATAQSVAGAGVGLTREAAVGDPACACTDPNALRPVTLDYDPGVFVGGDGYTADPFNGRTLPCFPEGGDVFGCTPCRDRDRRPDLETFARDATPFVGPGFFLDYFSNPTPSESAHDVEDMETGAVAKVAAAAQIPFIGFRSASDGMGDPLHLPGFPFQFFVYRQISATNAATMTAAFIGAWS